MRYCYGSQRTENEEEQLPSSILVSVLLLYRLQDSVGMFFENAHEVIFDVLSKVAVMLQTLQTGLKSRLKAKYERFKNQLISAFLDITKNLTHN